MRCPDDCNGNGKCLSMRQLGLLALDADYVPTPATYGSIAGNPATWDADAVFGCHCDWMVRGGKMGVLFSRSVCLSIEIKCLLLVVYIPAERCCGSPTDASYDGKLYSPFHPLLEAEATPNSEALFPACHTYAFSLHYVAQPRLFLPNDYFFCSKRGLP